MLTLFYVGHDTKAMRNNSGPRSKRSKLERDINWDVIACVFILISLCLICAIGRYSTTCYCGYGRYNSLIQISQELEMEPTLMFNIQ